MARESLASKKARATEAVKRIDQRYPGKAILLNHENPYQLLIAVLLSAQTTDKQVNKVTPTLFAHYPSPIDLAQAPLEDIEQIIKSLGFYKTKARHAKECAQQLVAEHGAEVPQTMEELTALAGVGRKTANIVLNMAFGIVEGIAVDTHVFRIATKLKLTNKKTPAQAEYDLLKVIPEQYWTSVNYQWVQFGREVCDAKNPHCDICPLVEICPSAFRKPKAKRRASK